jgi:hypothetical protein
MSITSDEAYDIRHDVPEALRGRVADPERDAHLVCPRCQPPSLMNIGDRLVAICGHEFLYSGNVPRYTTSTAEDCPSCLTLEPFVTARCHNCPA